MVWVENNVLFLPKRLEKGPFCLKLYLEFQLKLSGHADEADYGATYRRDVKSKDLLKEPRNADEDRVETPVCCKICNDCRPNW